MKSRQRIVSGGAVLVGSLLAIGAAQAAEVTLPQEAAGPVGAGRERGFVVRTAQAPLDAAAANNFIRATQQINGTLVDAGGTLVPNEAIAGANPDGSHNVDTINFEKDASPFEVYDADNNWLVAFSSDYNTGPSLFPGIPGNGGHTDKFAVEVIAFLELTAGPHTFGVSANADRTDVNDDDSYQVYVAANPHDGFGTKVAEFSRNAPAFPSNWHNENTWTVVAPVAGVYPFRLLYWQTGRGANLQWYTVDVASGARVLINDPNDGTALPAYRQSTAAAANTPYVAEVNPLPGSDGISASAPITALLVDGQTTVATADVKLFLNNTQVTPQTLSKADGRITLRYDPNAARTDRNNQVRLEFKDSAGATQSRSWAFTIVTGGGSSTLVTGQWDFDGGDLRATVGQPLEYFDGPNGLTQQGTTFGTTTSLGVADIGGQPAKVMHVPGEVIREIGYVMKHGIAPNGGGTKVNQWTIVMDVMVGTSGSGAASMIQIDSLDNRSDGDLFWQGSNFGQGSGGYRGTGIFLPGEWHRIVAAYDLAANPPVVTKFVDGVKQDDWIYTDDNPPKLAHSLDAPRRALQPTAILFADGDLPNPDERREWWVNSIQIRSGKLTDAEAVALGGPSADGIPQVIPASSVTGQWDFEAGNLRATVGKALEYFDGAEGLTQQMTQFGTTTDLGVADINGEPAKVMHVPGDVIREIGYVMTHGIAPNGGGTKVNQWTIVMDVMVGTSGPGAASMLQIDSLDNRSDGDLFWQGSNFGQGSGGYRGTGIFLPGEWHRIVAAYDLAADPPVVTKFVDGIKQDDWIYTDDNPPKLAHSLDAPRRALQPTAILFADGDLPNPDERREWWVNSIQIRAGKLSDAEAVALGGPSAKGIPVVIPKSTVTGQWDFDRGDLAATVGKPLQYFDGPDGVTKAGTTFGTTTDLGIADIGGQAAKVMYVPGDVIREIGYVMTHGIAPNGGGTKVNQWTIVMDVMVGTSGPGAASMLQIDSLDNRSDGDLFWQGSNFGQGSGGYRGTGIFLPGEWHRVAAAYDLAANPPVVTKFVDGIKQDDWIYTDDNPPKLAHSLDAPRRALQPTAILFADGDLPNPDERREWWVNSIQIRAGKLSDAEMVALGGPSASGIPVVIAGVTPPPTPPTITTALSGNNLTLSWPTTATGFTLQGTPALTAPNWQPVAGVVNNSVTVPMTGASQFYRLVQ